MALQNIFSLQNRYRHNLRKTDRNQIPLQCQWNGRYL